MAENTAKTLRNLVMYSVFTRNYSKEGTFDAVRRDLARIRSLGTDVIWLMPIHPIGEQNRKGTIGSPYAIRDYRAVDPSHGTVDDLRRLADDAHALGMRVIIDVVYNHTSPDSVLAHEHPEWFYRNAEGHMGNRFGDWADVVDLDYTNADLWDYQIDTLKMWAEIVDGFRCDVASLVPLEFWRRARREVETVRPGALWLAETVHPWFVREARAAGLNAMSDGEALGAFDVSYDYDAFPYLEGFFRGNDPISAWLDRLNMQEYIYPDNYVKLRFLENHDNPRARFWLPDIKALRSMTAFLFFQKGMTLLYAGQERALRHLPLLFEKDPIDLESGEDLSDYIRALSDMKRDAIFALGTFESDERGGAIRASYRHGDKKLYGVFPIGGKPGIVPVDMPDGVYEDRIDGRKLEVLHGVLSHDGEAAVFGC